MLAGVILAGPMVCATSQAVNDWFDRHVDAINEPNRPIPSGRVPGRWGLYIAIGWTVLSLLVATVLGPWGFGAAVVGLALAWAYSAPPIRLKRNGWWGNSAVAACYEGLPWFTGAAVLMAGWPGWPIVTLAALYSVGAHGIMTLNDFKSVEGDRRMGIDSLPVLLGIDRAAKVACLFMALPQLVVIARAGRLGQALPCGDRGLCAGRPGAADAPHAATAGRCRPDLQCHRHHLLRPGHAHRRLRGPPGLPGRTMTAVPLGWLGIVRLGLVQTALGAIVVLTTSTLNRVMVVELALPATLPGALVAMHYAVQVLRPRLGYGSDVSGRATPWIIGGMATLCTGGLLAAVATAWMTTSQWSGIALAVLAFLMIGVGVGASGTSRPRAAGQAGGGRAAGRRRDHRLADDDRRHRGHAPASPAVCSTRSRRHGWSRLQAAWSPSPSS